ncbi:hypothetical protein [Streptomyces sp. Z26]|uniref:hypothetical protein n=1 Tax=Streptomyces sp. Z26 TaxID=2500177 RepID=UPI000EF16FC3|nr:hypothetical protein [Streptomyces sp. Z26]RLL66970.1 hypothetical protein D7M15_08930 [Streptomyces sp. Z26]
MTNTRQARSNGARPTRCPRCHRPVLRQLVGQRAALDVTADTAPLAPAAAHALTGPNRLAWCLRQTRDGPDLRWTGPTHRAGCPHPHVIDHQCTAPNRPRAATATAQPGLF